VQNETVAQTYVAFRSRARDFEILPLSDAPGFVWLEGCLLMRDRQRDRLLIAFTDMDLDVACGLPALEIRRERYEDNLLGWGCFGVPRSLADQRPEHSARALRAKREQAAQSEPKRPVRRSKVFKPKKARRVDVSAARFCELLGNDAPSQLELF
jgi:hypothetical protein